MTKVLLGLGSNIEPRLDTLNAALQQLQGAQLSLLAVSSAYESLPYQAVGEGNYINLVALGETKLSPQVLLDFVLEVEQSLGRVRGEEKWGARTIDIDILAYNSLCLKEPGLEIPHYDLQNRDFFLIPIQEIAADFKDPKTETGIEEMIQSLPANLQTRLERLEWKFTL